MERATETAAQQIVDSDSRDQTNLAISSLTTAQVIKQEETNLSVAKTISTSESTVVVPSIISEKDIDLSVTANEIIKTSSVAMLEPIISSKTTLSSPIVVVSSPSVSEADKEEGTTSGKSISIPFVITNTSSVPLSTSEVLNIISGTKSDDQPEIVAHKIESSGDSSILRTEKDIVTDKTSIVQAQITASKITLPQRDNFIIQTRITNKSLTPIIAPTPIVDMTVKSIEIPSTKTVVSSLISDKDEINTRMRSMSLDVSFPETTLFSGSFAVGSDIYNLDTPDKDLRSYTAELLSSFDQLSSMLSECEIIAMIKDNNGKVVIVFRMGDFNNFLIKVSDTFYDRKVFYSGYTTIETANSFLVSPFVDSIPRTDPPSDMLSFNREQAKEAAVRNKATMNKYGINIDLNYSIFGTDEERAKAKRLLEIGVFDYNYNPHIQDDSIFVHKIYGADAVSAPMPPATASISSPVLTSAPMPPTATLSIATGFRPTPVGT
ncbi:MAG: hypothetical protein WC438_05600 [Candidatus Pacearchaeota archaeon]